MAVLALVSVAARLSELASIAPTAIDVAATGNSFLVNVKIKIEPTVMSTEIPSVKAMEVMTEMLQNLA
jgi:hypothetical protein